MRKSTAQKLVGYLFILPDFSGLIIFMIFPIILGFSISLHSWNGIGKMLWVGLKNYHQMFSDPTFIHSVYITIKYVILFVPINFLISLLLALLVKKPLRGLSIYRAIYFAPCAISLVSNAFVWKYMFQQNGLINSVLIWLGFQPQSWLGSMYQAFLIILAFSLYTSAGYYMIIFLAGLNDIPEEYYDAARVDGASSLQSFWHITLPLLKPTSFFVLIMTLIQSFQIFDQIYVLTSGGPFYATSTVVFYAFQSAFQYYQFGYASAMDFFIFIVLFILSMLFFTTLKGGKRNE